MTKKIIIGSRGSKLALLYAQKAKEQIIKKTTLDTNDIEIKSISTKGDQVKDTRLSDIGGKGLFSTEIEKELENKSIDIAVHALKDMPATETTGLKTDCFLERNDPLLFFIQRLRDEAHRFAISTHRAKRKKNLSKSLLDQIQGIGKQRKRALLNHFGSARAVESASFDDLKSVEGIEDNIAKKIYDYFHE